MPAWLRLLRPHQWIKNSFVFVGLLFGHAWNDPQLLQSALLAFAAFCLTSSTVYALNDIADRVEDRAHPKKSRRPVASGAISPQAGYAIASACFLGGMLLASLCGKHLVMLLVGYLLLQVAYSHGLKHVVILDVFLIASGFMLRILAGTLGIGIPPSQWLLLCGLLLTLFLGFAKRRAELMLLEDAGGNHRRVLEHYSEGLLDQMIAVTAAGVLVAYCLYTVSPDTVALHGTDKLVYTIPFVLYGMFRYLYLLHQRGGGGDPAQEVVGDWHIIASGAAWLATTLLLLRA
ncbi:MAG: decaprenyl-phosphate phosphoribosyltransferase [Rhodocyclaceae bacterium]|nr:decaprenyl-phosphate phosphoribosyltransferase [Rhodocyclaceae bacterium]